VFLTDFPKAEGKYIDDKLDARGKDLFPFEARLRRFSKRSAGTKKIGHSLDAGVTLYASPELYDLLSAYSKDLAFIFIVSSVLLEREAGAPADSFTSDSVQGLRIGRRTCAGKEVRPLLDVQRDRRDREGTSGNLRTVRGNL